MTNTLKRTDRMTLAGKYVDVIVENGVITELSVAGSPMYGGSRSRIGAAVLDDIITELRSVQETVFPEYVKASNSTVTVTLPKDTWPAVERRHGAPDLRSGAGPMDPHPEERRAPLSRYIPDLTEVKSPCEPVPETIRCSFCGAALTTLTWYRDASPKGPRCPACDVLVKPDIARAVAQRNRQRNHPVWQDGQEPPEPLIEESV